MAPGLIPPGARVHLHQAFRCCPYAGAISSRIHDYLEQNGFVVVDTPEEADAHILNTCGSDARQASLTWDALAALGARAPAAPVVVAGCLVSIEPAALATALAPFGQTARFDPRHLTGLDDVFRPSAVAFDAVQPSHRNVYVGNDFSDGWAHVLASTGCVGTCGFCAIRRATGRPKSRSIDEILADVAAAETQGTHDVLLVSTDLGAWGIDRGEDVTALVLALADAPGDHLLSVESFEPTLFLRHFEALLPALASGRFAFVALPIQSGSVRVLRSMDRAYDPADVLRAVDRLRAAAPDLVLRTDILYGFGDETDAEFEESVLASRAFDLPSFNAYQQRPGTPAVTLPDAVLCARRDRAMAELQVRARAGLRQVRRWGRDTPPVRPGGEAVRAGEALPEADTTPAPVHPWDTPEGRGWITEHARRFAAVITRVGIPLGEGWGVVAAHAGSDAVLLSLASPEGESLEVGLRPPQWPGAAAARTPRYAASSRAESLTPGQDRAFSRLLSALGGA